LTTFFRTKTVIFDKYFMRGFLTFFLFVRDKTNNQKLYT